MPRRHLPLALRAAVLLAVSAAGCVRDTRGPENAVREAIAAARAEDALSFQAHVETSLIPPEDGVVLASSLSNVVRIGDARRAEDLASVSVDVRAPGLDTTITLNLRLRKAEGRWKVVQVEDAGRFARTLVAARRARLERANVRIEDEIRRRVQLGAVQRTVRFRDVDLPNQLYRYADVGLRVPVYNARREELRHVEVEVLITDSTGTEYRYRLATRTPVSHETSVDAALDTTYGVLTGYPTDYEHGAEVDAILHWRLASARPIAAVFGTDRGVDTIRPYLDWQDYLRRRGH